ncbi:MAG: glyoxalase [Flavobacteriaceae bacterium]
MSTRSEKLLQQRPDIPTSKINDQMGSEEYFQNAVLRPILKLQNDLFINVFKNYIKKHKNVFYELSIEKKQRYVEHAIQKDIKFRNSLKGMIIGMFTVEEYETYTMNSSALNKRMMNLLIVRLKDQLLLFDRIDAA